MATTVTSPLDVCKTLIMSAHLTNPADVLGKHPIKIMIHMVKTEGFGSLFKGWTAAFVRLGPHTIVTFLVMERLKDWHAQLPEQQQDDTITSNTTTTPSTANAATTTIV